MKNIITPKKSMILSIAFLLIAFPVAMYADSTKNVILYALTVIFVLLSVGVRLIFGRCPHCGSLLRTPWINLCPTCGQAWKE